MAENAAEKPPGCSGGGGGGATPGKTLDVLSKEDLIKFSKKQAVNVSQMKSKIVDLQKANSALIKERDELRSEMATAKDKASQLQEENDCLNQKVETVTASYLAVVDEADKTSSHDDCERERNKLKRENQHLEDLLSNVSMSLDEVEREKKNLSDDLRLCKTALEELQTHNVGLKASVQRTLEDDGIVEDLRSELRAKAEEMTTLKETLDRSDVLRCQLDEQVAEWRRSFDECQSTMHAMKEENERMNADAEKSIEELSLLKSELDQVKEEKSTAEEREAKKKAMAQKMKAELLRRREEEKNRSVNESLDQSLSVELESRVSFLEKELEEEKNRLRAANDSFQVQMGENERLIAENESYDDEIRKLTSLKEELLQKVKSLEKNDDSRVANINSLKEEVSSLKAMNFNLVKERDELTQRMAEQVCRAEEAKQLHDQTLEESSTRLRELSDLNQRLTDDNSRLREAEGKTQSTENDKLESTQIDRNKSKEDELRRCLEETESQRDSAKLHITQLENKIAEFEEEKVVLRENLSKTLQKEDDDTGESQRQNPLVEEEMAELRRQLDELTEAVAEKDQLYESLGQEVAELKTSLQEKSRLIVDMEERIKVEEDASKESQGRIEELNRGVEERDEKLDLIESEVEELQKENARLEAATVEKEEERCRLEQALLERERDEALINEEREQFKAAIIVKEEKMLQRESEHAEKLMELNGAAKRAEEETKATANKLSATVKSLEEEKSRHKQTYAKLENLKKTQQKKSLVNLEIADYEKTVDQLTRTIEERDKEKAELKEEIRHREEKIEALISEKSNVEIQREEENQRAEMIKANLEKVKMELETSRDADHARHMREIEAEQRVESLRREVEEAKMAMADAAALAKKNEDDLARKWENEQRAYKTLQSRYELVEDELQHAQLEIVAVKEEMSNYKTKAQAVLKQAKAEAQNSEAAKLAKEEMQRMGMRTKELEAEVDSLQNEIRETIDEADVVKADREELRRAHGDVLRQLHAAEDRHRSASKEWEREQKTRKDHYESSIQSLTDRQNALIESHRDKLFAARQEFETQLATVQRVADSNEQEVFRLQKELQIALAVSSSDLQQHHHQPHGSGLVSSSGGMSQPLMSSSAVADGESGSVLRGAAFISSIERQEGEGMEHTDTSDCGSPSPSQVRLSALVNYLTPSLCFSFSLFPLSFFTFTSFSFPSFYLPSFSFILPLLRFHSHIPFPLFNYVTIFHSSSFSFLFFHLSCCPP